MISIINQNKFLLGDWFTEKKKPKMSLTRLGHLCSLSLELKPHIYRMTSIICTLGPSSNEPSVIEKMIEAGMSIARLNFSHGSYDYHSNVIKNVRTAAENHMSKTGIPTPIGIALDTKGPEIRTGVLTGGASAEVELVEGKTIRITTDKSFANMCTEKDLWVDYANMPNIVEPGNKIYIDDGLISLVVQSIMHDSINCVIENGGKLSSKKGVNLPGVDIDLPAVSEKDKDDLKFGVDQGVDIIFASFIRDGNGVRTIRKILGEDGKKIAVISKIENHQGIQNIDEILNESDGIMVARGDLGIEIPIEQVFPAQKCLIAKCNKAGKPVICATQMLESMIVLPRPTRAEVSDVGNAVVDGADCVMLSGETAKGKHPIKCISMMSKICKEAEGTLWHRQTLKELIEEDCESNTETAIAIAAVEASLKVHASVIIIHTLEGKSSYSISRFRPHCPIVVVTRNAQVARQSHLHRGIIPVLFTGYQLEDWRDDVEQCISYGLKVAVDLQLTKVGDQIIIVTRGKAETGSTNSVRIMNVPSDLTHLGVMKPHKE